MILSKWFAKEKGVALPVVLVVLAVLTISTAATIQVVSSENRMGIHDEQQTKAYYIARSAVDLVSNAIVDKAKDVNAKAIALQQAVNAYNSHLFSDSEEASDAGVAAIAALQSAYDAARANLDAHVLPASGTTFTHQIAGVSAGSVPVTVRQVSAGRYEVSAAVTLSPSTAVGRSTKIIDLAAMPSQSGRIIKRVSTTTTETITIPAGTPGSFDDAAYSYDDMTYKNNTNFFEGATSNPANVQYEGDLDSGSHTVGTIKKTANSTPQEPATLLPIKDINEAPFLASKGTLPSSLTPADNGYYPLINNSGTIQVDASTGNVIIKTNRINVANQVDFVVTGPYYFYIYLYDTFKTTSTGGDFIFYAKNGFGMDSTDADHKPRAFLIIDQPGTGSAADRDPRYNYMDVNNKATFNGYIYAPYSTIDFKNSLTAKGSFIGGTVVLKNNNTIRHVKPSGGSYSDDGGDTVITYPSDSTTTTETDKGGYSFTAIDIPATGIVPETWVR